MFTTNTSAPLQVPMNPRLEVKNTSDRELIKSLLNTGTNKCKISDRSVRVVRYSQRFIRPLLHVRTQAVISELATGKSTAVRKFLDQHPELSTLVLSTRITYTQFNTASLNQGKSPNAKNWFHNYLNVIPTKDHSHLVIQVESIHKIKRVYSIIIMDEATSVLAQFDSRLHGNMLSKNRQIMAGLIRDADFVIALDAHLDNRTMGFLTWLRGEDPIHLAINTYRRYVGCKLICLSHVRFKQGIRTALLRGERLQIILGSAKYGLTIIEPLLKSMGIKYRFYWREGEGYSMDEFQNVNACWTEFQVIMHTSTVGSGIDFNIPDYFDSRFIQANSRTNTYQEIIQMTGRVRDLNKSTAYVVYQTWNDRLEEDYDALMAKWQSKLDASDASTVRNFSSVYERTITGDCFCAIQEDVWTWLTLQNQIHQNRSRNRFKLLFIGAMRAAGWEYSEPEDKVTIAEEQEFSLEWSLAKMELKNHEREMLIRAPIVEDPIEIEFLEEQNRLGKLDRKQTIIHRKAAFYSKFERSLWGSITTDMLCEGFDHVGELININRLLRLTPEEIANIECRRRRYSFDPNPRIAKVDCLLWLCGQLGINGIRDRRTVVPQSRIVLDDWKMAHAHMKIVFDLVHKCPTDLLTAHKLIDSILRKGACCRLKPGDSNKRLKDKITKRKVQTYTLVPLFPSLDALLDLMLPPKRPPKPEMPKSPLPPEASLMQQVQYLDKPAPPTPKPGPRATLDDVIFRRPSRLIFDPPAKSNFPTEPVASYDTEVYPNLFDLLFYDPGSILIGIGSTLPGYRIMVLNGSKITMSEVFPSTPGQSAYTTATTDLQRISYDLTLRSVRVVDELKTAPSKIRFWSADDPLVNDSLELRPRFDVETLYLAVPGSTLLQQFPIVIPKELADEILTPKMAAQLKLSLASGDIKIPPGPEIDVEFLEPCHIPWSMDPETLLAYRTEQAHTLMALGGIAVYQFHDPDDRDPLPSYQILIITPECKILSSDFITPQVRFTFGVCRNHDYTKIHSPNPKFDSEMYQCILNYELMALGFSYTPCPSLDDA